MVDHAPYSAIVLQSLIEGQEPPPVPESEAEDRVLLSLAREELIDLRERYDRF